VYALHSWIDELDYTVEPEVECPDNDPSDAAVVRATTTIRGHDDVEEYVACNVYPLAASFSFESAPLGMTLVPKVETPLPLFAVGTIAAEHADHFLAKVKTKTERVLGSFGPRKYNALMIANIPNGGHLNHVLEQMGAPYFPRPQPGSAASQSTNEKWKAEVAKKPATKKAKAGTSQAPSFRMVPPLPKVGPTKKVGVLKISRPKARPGP
jgi:hypothetical protein